MLVVRQEVAQDHQAVYAIVSAAFKTSDEADLVNRLRPIPGVISMVAEEEGELIGHIMFSPVRLINKNGTLENIKIAGLAPVSVKPGHQRNGVGKALINAGLKACQDVGVVASILLGHPEYYPKFGFQPAFSTFGIQSTYDVSDPVFMALELKIGALKDVSGVVHYHDTFNGI